MYSTNHLPARTGETVKLSAWRLLAAAATASGATKLGTPPGNAVLMYHSVGGPHGNPRGTFPTARLRADLTALGAMYRIVDLPAVLEPSTRPRLAVTFDDGYRDFATEALPVLEELDVPTTLFVVSSIVSPSGCDPEAISLTAGQDEMLSGEEIRELVDHSLVTIGNHTVSHAALPKLGEEDLHREVVGAKEALERQFGIEVERFCYPGGKVNERSRSLVRHTHDLGVGVKRGLIDPPVDDETTSALPRIDGARSAAEVRWETSKLGETLRRQYSRFGDR